MGKSVKKIPTGKLARTTITGMTAAKVGAKHLAYLGKTAFSDKTTQQETKDLHEEEIGKILFQTLSQLRGTALKVSQMLSMQIDLFPETIRQELAKACHQVLPLNRALIRKAFLQEFQTVPETLFQQFDSKAFAAASLGQVHEAISFDGEPLAVKIQYPGIAASIDSDIKMIRGILTTLSSRTDYLPKKELIHFILDEIETRLQEEVDYNQEAENTRWFAQHLKMDWIQVPEVLPEFSSKRVLTLKKLAGLHLKEWLATNPPQEEKNHFGQLLYDFFLHSVFELKHLHADPHPGNFLFMEGGRLGLLDFGCIKHLNEDYPQKMAHLLNAHIKDYHQDNSKELLEACQALEILPQDFTVKDFQELVNPFLKPLQAWLVEPFLKESFDFSTKSPYPQHAHEEAKKTVKYLSGLHQDQVYYDRSFVGLILMLQEIGAVVRTQNPWFGESIDF